MTWNVLQKKNFFDSVRHSLFAGELTLVQVKGCEQILDYWQSLKLKDIRWLAYILATAYHETARTMAPLEEYGKGRGHRYGKRDRQTGHRYYGRGFVQLTWKENYEKMGRKLGYDLVNEPERACEPEIATRILFEGMIAGDFTGKKLIDYFNDTKSDWVNARKIVNGLDKSRAIAKIAQSFYSVLQAVEKMSLTAVSPAPGRDPVGARPKTQVSRTPGKVSIKAILAIALFLLVLFGLIYIGTLPI